MIIPPKAGICNEFVSLLWAVWWGFVVGLVIHLLPRGEYSYEPPASSVVRRPQCMLLLGLSVRWFVVHFWFGIFGFWFVVHISFFKVFGTSCIFPFLHCFLPMGWLQQHIVIHIYVGCLFVCSLTLAFIIGTKAAILSSLFSCCTVLRCLVELSI